MSEVSLHSFKSRTVYMNDIFPLYVTDDAKGTVSVTVKDQHLRGDNGLIDVQ